MTTAEKRAGDLPLLLRRPVNGIRGATEQSSRAKCPFSTIIVPFGTADDFMKQKKI
jgi:hypothetical protein